MIHLVIFELTEEQENAQEAGVEIKLEDCDKKAMTFHSIDYVKPIGEYCLISSGGDLFTVNETADSVNRKIQERKTFLFN